MLQVQRPQGARPRLRARLHHRQRREDEQEPRHRHLAAALPRARHERRVAALLHRRQARTRTSRTSSSTRTTSSPASTATWSASTSTSPAGRANFINKHFEPGELRYRGDTAAPLDAQAAPRARAGRATATKRASSARRCARSWRWPTAINGDFDAAPALGAGQGAESRAAELQDVCSRALHGLPAALDPARAGAAGADARVARELFRPRPRLHLERRSDAVPTPRSRAYQHLMQRVDPKQLDALFEPPAPAADARAAGRRRRSSLPLPGGEAIARDDRDRRLRQARPAHRPDRRLREGRGLDQAAQAHARRRRGATAHRLQRHPVGLFARAAGRQAHGAWSPTWRRAR